MGNCGTRSSATDDIEDIKEYPGMSFEQLDRFQIGLCKNFAKYTTKYPDIHKSPNRCSQNDPSFDQISNHEMPCDISTARSITPNLNGRPKSYIKCPSLENTRLNGSSSPISYRGGGGGSISSERRHQLEQRPNSASHLMKYSINNGNTNCHSPSANTICRTTDRRASPTVKQTQFRALNNHSSSNSEKNIQRLNPKPVQQKYLVHQHHSKTVSKYYVAIFDYKARNDEDLTIHIGDIVIILDRNDSDWWLVENATTHSHGYVPSAYLAEEDSIEVFEWYFREISRKDAERLLVQHGNPIGTFLVRPSETTNGGLSLSIRYDEGKVCHFKIKHDPPTGGICITSSLVFPDLVSLIEHYTAHADGLCCRLSQPYPRPPPFLSDLSRRTKDHWEIERSSLVLIEHLGEGQFGEVWRGEYEGSRPVAIKTLKEGTMSKEEFLKEARIMKALRHKNLVQLFAVVTSEPIYIVTELMSKGSLLKYLRSDIDKKIGLKEQVDFMGQIASGMAYLEGMGLVHRDLAARNVLVGDDDIVKIADFGLTRAINASTNAYTAKQGSKFPIKWTAPEAACHCQFTIKSDVWSFGVVMYEIVTHGQEPFPSMSTLETLEQVNNGYRMPRPSTCPIQIYEKMLQCWDRLPNNRPTFVELLDYFNRYPLESPSPEEVDAMSCDGRFRRRAGYPYMGSPARFTPVNVAAV